MMKKQVTDHIEELKKQIEEWKAKYLRALADYQNLEKRVNQERKDFAFATSKQIIAEFLPVLDTFEKAEKHLQDAGLTLALKDFWSVLAGHGVRKIEVLHKTFNPHEMECVEVVESNKENEVIEEIRPGYTIGDNVIRVAHVKVGKAHVNQKEEGLAKEELRKGDYM